MRQWTAIRLVAMVALTACQRQQVRVDETTVAGHEAEAARERRLAEKERRAYDPDREELREVRPLARTGGDAPSGELITINPTDVHLRAAEARRRHAAAHDQAAQALKAFEDRACADVAAEHRVACPSLLATTVQIIPQGIRLLCGPQRLDTVLAQMRCHLAFARARGYGQPELCPFALPGVQAEPAIDHSGVELRSDDPATVRLLQTLDIGRVHGS
jgi:hypothetical protein